MGQVFDKIVGEITPKSAPPPTQQPVDDPELSRELNTVRRELVKTHMVQKMLRDGSPEPAPPPALVAPQMAESAVGATVKAIAEAMSTREKINGDTINTLLGRVIDISNRPTVQSPSADMFVQYVMDDLKTLKNQPGLDPMSSLTSMIQLADKLEEIKSRYAPPPGPPPQDSVATLGIQAHLKQMEIQHAEVMQQRQIEAAREERRWQLERDEKQHQWEVDKELRQEELLIRKMELNQGRSSRDQAAGALVDLVGSVVDNVGKGGNGNGGSVATNNVGRSIGANPEAVRREVQRGMPKRFMCPECQEEVHVPNPNSDEVVCRGCGAVYDLTPYHSRSGVTTTPPPLAATPRAAPVYYPPAAPTVESPPEREDSSTTPEHGEPSMLEMV